MEFEYLQTHCFVSRLSGVYSVVNYAYVRSERMASKVELY